MPIGDIDPRYSINSLASVSKLGGNAIPSAFAVLEIDNNLKSHVQQRPPGVIFALGAGIVTGPADAFANCGNMLAMQTRDRFDRFSRRNAHGNN